jgi:hypothetical protein
VPITVESVVTATKEQISADLQGEAVVLDLTKDVYYGLDEVGARIWALIREPRKVSEIRDAIVAEYDVDQETCQRDLIGFLHSLEGEGLVVVSAGETG